MRQYFDVFNGDADGLCALVQLRLARPLASTLITGVKRDIQLLQQVEAKAGDKVVVLDVALEKNRQALDELLEKKVKVFYCDHHLPGDIPESEYLKTIINTEANVCTSLLINGFLKNQYALWAIVGAFGDNLDASAKALAKPLQLGEANLQLLKNLGMYINYNGYGSSEDDLHFKPADLFRELVEYPSPLDFIAQNRAAFEKLENGYNDDMAKAAQSACLLETDKVCVRQLPDEKWARRVSGVFGNDLANQSPDKAHAVLTDKAPNGFLVSVRAPLNNKQGAATLCKQFEGGGGREAAAGINDLAKTELPKFLELLQAQYN